MEFLYSITTYKCGVYNIPEKLQMITTFFTYYGTNLVFPVETYGIKANFNDMVKARAKLLQKPVPISISFLRMTL